MRRGYAAFVVSMTLVSGAAIAANAEFTLDPGFQPAFATGGDRQKPRLVAPLRAVWRMPGYGYVLDLRGDAPAAYVEAGTLCWPMPLEADSLGDYLGWFRTGAGGSAVLTDGPGGTQYPVQRLPAVPEACRAGTKPTNENVFDAMWQGMQDRYAFFRQRGIDWQQRREQFRPKAIAAKDDAELFAVLRETLGGFDDGHLWLQGDVGGEAQRFSYPAPSQARLRQTFPAGTSRQQQGKLYTDWLAADLARINNELLEGRMQSAAAGQFRWGRIGPRIGYLWIGSMMGYGGQGPLGNVELAAAATDQALRDLADTDAIIVDVSQNKGGEDRVARTIANRFADRQRPAYSKQLYRSSAPLQRFSIAPAGVRYGKPVWLLTSDMTGSAAEIFTMTMTELPQVTQIGGRTDGAFSDILVQPLPNGWMLSISNEIYRDPAGGLAEAAGVPPHQPIEVFPADVAAGHVAAVRETARRAGQGAAR